MIRLTKTPALVVKIIPVHIRKCGKYSKAFKRERIFLNWKVMKWIRRYSWVISLPLSIVTTNEFFLLLWIYARSDHFCNPANQRNGELSLFAIDLGDSVSISKDIVLVFQVIGKGRKV